MALAFASRIVKSVALVLARSGTRVNAVTTGPADTGMLSHFTGKPENKPASVTEVPVGWLCLSEELANPMGFLVSEGAHISRSSPKRRRLPHRGVTLVRPRSLARPS
jgi:NAD(P)-dependent dehydrogenase (short-subunit alcohol dehydrogenase family)